MLCFIVPLKPRAAAADWGDTARLFRSTLRSIAGQTDPAWRAVVVCRDVPDLQGFEDERVTLVNPNMPLPDPGTPNRGMVDKWNQVWVGLAHAAEWNPNFVMIADADDLVSNRLAAVASSSPDANGWVVSRGYEYKTGSKFVSRVDSNFHLRCGTSAIVSARLFRFPTLADDMSERKKCLLLKHGHTRITDELERADTPLAHLPFPGTMYVHHAGNETVGVRRKVGLRQSIADLFRVRPFTATLRREFGMMC